MACGLRKNAPMDLVNGIRVQISDETVNRIRVGCGIIHGVALQLMLKVNGHVSFKQSDFKSLLDKALAKM